jgi:transposase
LTFEPGASVALVARAHGVNANQVFKWRRELKSKRVVFPCKRHFLAALCAGY